MLEIFVGLVALLLALPFVVLSVEAGAALFARKHEISSRKPRLAVLIPAHNEASEIEATIRSVRGEIGVGDRIVVVSDNSTDATGELAEELGAQVVTRIDPDHFGKGYALEAGIRHLSLDPPEVVIVVDADCRPESGAIARIATRAKAEGRAIQGASLVRPAEDAFLPKVSALAFHIRNEVRPRGLARLDLPVLLQGTGMAIPWLQIAEADLGGSHLAEDRKLGIALALDERTPRAEPEARFWSALETGGSVADGQRSRWERGHLAAIREDVPRLLRAAVHQRRPELCALAAELAVPPLTLLLGAWVVSLLAAAVIASSAPLACALVLPGAIAFGLLALASMRSLSTPISSRFLLAAPLYALAKVPLYLRAVRRQSVGWQRAKRPTEPRKADAPAHASDVETYQIGGVDVHPLTESECVTRILDSCDAGRGGWVVTPNVDFLERSNRDSGFRALLRLATLSVPDGMPLVWAARIGGNPVPERVAGSSLISSLCSAAADRGRSVFLLGGNEGTAATAAKVLLERHPHLRIAGWLCPPFGFEEDDEELRKISSTLEATKPDLVFMGLGSPKADRLIASLHLTHRASLPSTWWLGVGVSFSFLCGEIDRAPEFLQRFGLEWAHRLFKEPRRLAHRYLVRDLPFALRLLASAAARRAFARTKA